MKKRIFAIILIAICCLLTSCVSTDGYSYNIITGTLTVHKIDTSNDDAEQLFWDIKRPITIKIGSGVTKIPDFMFASQHDGMSGDPRNYYDATRKVTIAQGVKHIGEDAFWCNGMKTINIPDSVTTIGSSAFDSCENLKSISLPGSISTIEYSTFANCINLESVELGEGIKFIEEDAFTYCESLTEVTFPSTLEKISDGAFYLCKNLQTVTFLNKDTKIAMNSIGVCDGDPFTRKDGFTIKGYKGSTAEEYANKFDFTFVSLD